MRMKRMMFTRLVNRETAIAIIGLGHTGLPMALAFSKHVPVIGYDANAERIERYRQGMDTTGDVGFQAIRDSQAEFTSDESRLEEADFYIITVPTSTVRGLAPDLSSVLEATQTVARRLKVGAIVVYETTLYPGMIEEACIPVLEEVSGLLSGEEFKVGCSPGSGRGDEYTETARRAAKKVVSGMDDETLDIVASVYSIIADGGVFRAGSMKAAELAQAIGKARSDLHLAFMNELSMLCHRLGIDTNAALEAAGVYEEELPIRPGLSGVQSEAADADLLRHAEAAGYAFPLLRAGRHINDGMGRYIAQQFIKQLTGLRMDIRFARVGIIGFATLVNNPDIRHTQVSDIVDELQQYGIYPIIVDPLVDSRLAYEQYGVELSDLSALHHLNAVLVATPHQMIADMDVMDFDKLFGDSQKKLLCDVKGIYNREEFESQGYRYWSL
ncbi:nucleotide sugar dehydrogenase [Paenibacillus sp. 1011MAR3C5]|uniref:nucleotide sugar dehydrogenase n=1 Tax=Paenibacillus sp. 1011MAR3C5 TaxID=1675787 RepID=UPI001600F138|nr:nucleotide sugar dehydrogenase [Paenibacillus sp. 1011MAR3C5]